MYKTHLAKQNIISFFRIISKIFIFYFQLDTGERLQAEFSPSKSLAEVLDRWKDQTSVRPGLHRVCIYMREEVLHPLTQYSWSEIEGLKDHPLYGTIFQPQ